MWTAFRSLSRQSAYDLGSRPWRDIIMFMNFATQVFILLIVSAQLSGWHAACMHVCDARCGEGRGRVPTEMTGCWGSARSAGLEAI